MWIGNDLSGGYRHCYLPTKDMIYFAAHVTSEALGSCLLQSLEGLYEIAAPPRVLRFCMVHVHRDDHKRLRRLENHSGTQEEALLTPKEDSSTSRSGYCSLIPWSERFPVLRTVLQVASSRRGLSMSIVYQNLGRRSFFDQKTSRPTYIAAKV